MELNLKTKEGDIIISRLLYPDKDVWLEVWESYNDELSGTSITKEQAIQIINHLKNEFNL